MNLELWRKTKQERGMTYHDIAKRSGLPLGTIKNIFAGYTPDPRESTIKAIESALGVETNVVYIKKTSPTLTQEEEKLLNEFRTLQRGERAQILEYVEYVAQRRGNKNKNA